MPSHPLLPRTSKRNPKKGGAGVPLALVGLTAGKIEAGPGTTTANGGMLAHALHDLVIGAALVGGAGQGYVTGETIGMTIAITVATIPAPHEGMTERMTERMTEGRITEPAAGLVPR